MARYTQPRRTWRYTNEFKVKAVELSHLEDVKVQEVAKTLDIHPFMLSRWRKEYREGKMVTDKRKKLDVRYLCTGLGVSRSRETYGSPRIHRTLKSQGFHVGGKRVARLAPDMSIKGRVVTVTRQAPKLGRFQQAGENFGCTLPHPLDAINDGLRI